MRGFPLLLLAAIGCTRALPRPVLDDHMLPAEPAQASLDAGASLDADVGETGAAAIAEPKSPFFFANDDPSDDLVVAPPEVRADCDERLKAAGVRFQRASIPVHKEGKNRMVCGAEQLVTFFRSKEGISYNAPPTLSCSMALALARFETIVQEEALRTFKKRVQRVSQLGTYACREMAAYRGWVSEHSYANAIDLETFVLSDGREISVLRHFEKTSDPPKRKEGEFLRAISRRAYDEGIFSTVLTPYFDALHRNHFHVDLARYRTDGSRPCDEGGC